MYVRTYAVITLLLVSFYSIQFRTKWITNCKSTLVFMHIDKHYLDALHKIIDMFEATSYSLRKQSKLTAITNGKKNWCRLHILNANEKEKKKLRQTDWSTKNRCFYGSFDDECWKWTGMKERWKKPKLRNEKIPRRSVCYIEKRFTNDCITFTKLSWSLQSIPSNEPHSALYSNRCEHSAT